ncbi:BRO family protein [Macrococcus capreoli]|uniref:BRO family protein n=1 Tax=Macrococcus capreoli TaxID=2982690 RepID=UPI0021D6016A|nr:BRO family protein [Macrococcus sp. TMW 2.2395]MCU7557284.1 BRO family protein [Macrococcus sp. TMW 2.2395]
MSKLKIFDNEQFGSLQVLEREGRVFFPATDVALKLGYSNPRDAIKRHVKEHGVVFHDVIDTLGRKQEKKYISEGNLYRLISNSKLESAQQFEEWVFDDVLPTLRMTGTYQVKPLTTQEQIKLIAQGNNELVERVEAIESAIPVFPGESKHIQQTVRRKAMEVMKNQFNGIPISKISRKVYSALYRSLYTAFKVPNYQSIPRGKYKEAIKFIETWHLPSEIGYQIEAELSGDINDK